MDTISTPGSDIGALDRKASHFVYSFTFRVMLWTLCCLATASGAQTPGPRIGVDVNGEPVAFQGLGPQQVQGRVLVPLRGVLEKLGAQVGWDQHTHTVVASNGKVDIQLQIGAKTATVDGNVVPLDVPAEVIAGSTFVPLRFIGQALGADVGWNQQTHTVLIVTKDQFSGSRVAHTPRRHDGPAPVIDSITQDAKGWLRAGDTLHVTLQGSPGCRASFHVPGLVTDIPMKEIAPGRYVGIWSVPSDLPIHLTDAAVIGVLDNDGQMGPMLQAAQPLSVDTIRPTVRDRAPSPDAHVSSARPNIYAVFDVQGANIVMASIRLLVDGQDVTSKANVTRDFISYVPDSELPTGPNAVEIHGIDEAGNSFGERWAFIDDHRQSGGIASVKDNADHPLLPGDVLKVEVTGAPGSKASFSLGPITNIPLPENAPGHYQADYTIRRGDDVNGARVVARLTNPDGQTFEESSSRAVTVDTGKPVAPVISYPVPNTMPSNPLIVRGHALPNFRVHVRVDYHNSVLGLLALQGTAAEVNVKADRNGNWATPPIDLSTLFGSRGVQYNITAVAFSATNQHSDTTAMSFRLH